MWLSFMRTCSPRELLWLWQPPHRTAYFSSARYPGVVFRVSTTRTPVPAHGVGKVSAEGRDSGEVLDEIERRPFSGQD